MKRLLSMVLALGCAAMLVADQFAPPPNRVAETEPIHVLDLTGLYSLHIDNPEHARQVWDALHFSASLQGIVNRKGPRLFIRFMAWIDDFWFQWCTTETGWLAKRSIVRHAGVDGLLELTSLYSDEFAGFVSYPNRPFALSNVASTIAGAERRLVLRQDDSPKSLYRRFLALPRRPKDELNLGQTPLKPAAGSCGSSKNDAYRWALERYLLKGKCSDRFMAYYIDSYYLTRAGAGGGDFANSTLTNHDFYIANGAFFFDLDPWGDERPDDDPEQPLGSDRTTLLALLKAQSKRARGMNFIVGGFPPWAWKYADPQHREHSPDGKKHPVKTEWEYCRVLSSYNGVKDADALGFSGMVNASFYRFYPLKARYPQPGPAPTAKRLREVGALDANGRVADRLFVSWYIGDYDAAAWLNRFAPQWWKDPAHGKTMCSWAFDPVLAVRAPHAVDYVRTKAAKTDFFISGDNGFGYLAPSALSAPRLDPSVPDGWSAWTALNREAYRRFDLDITGFIIDPGRRDGGARVLKEYAAFSRGGFVYDVGQTPGGVKMQDGVPCVRMLVDLVEGDPVKAGQQLASMIKPLSGPRFLMVRSILKSPTWHAGVEAELVKQLGDRVRVLDPRCLFEAAKRNGE